MCQGRVVDLKLIDDINYGYRMKIKDCYLLRRAKLKPQYHNFQHQKFVRTNYLALGPSDSHH